MDITAGEAAQDIITSLDEPRSRTHPGARSVTAPAYVACTAVSVGAPLVDGGITSSGKTIEHVAVASLATTQLDAGCGTATCLVGMPRTWWSWTAALVTGLMMHAVNIIN